MNDKETHERVVFEEFATAAGLTLDADSVSNERPPKPDIRCKVSGETRFFELARLVDPTLAQDVNESIRRLQRGDKRVVTSAVSLKDPLIERIRGKAAKDYETDGAPVDLLLYYDSEIPAFELPPPGQFAEWAKAYMLPEIQKNPGPFARFWVLDRNEKRVLWCHEVKGDGKG